MLSVAPSLTQYSVPGILALLILKEVFTFVKTRNGRSPIDSPCSFEITHSKRLSDLYNWHKPDEESGRFRWYAHDDEIIRSVAKIGHEIVHEIRELRKAVVKNGHS